MGLSDLGARLKSWLNGNQGFSSRRPDGGTSCYRPMQRRNRQEESLAQEKAAEYAAGQGKVEILHSGFTGMNPPDSGAMPVSSTQGYSGYAPVMGGPAQGPQNFQYFQDAPNSQAGGNISYMPGSYAPGPDAGNTFTHVEHIFTITSLRGCYEAIECMKNEETLIVSLDVLGSDGERIRCQDMLAGAAFTLGCSVRNLPSVGVVIIAPAGVKILPERQVRSWDQPQPAQAVSQAPAETGYIPRRERRNSRNAVGWENATSGMSLGYNPYTGSMPAAAGAYSAYGGY